jgi:hypothetical protein
VAEPGITVLADAGHGAQRHLALTGAGAQAIVSLPALDAAPVGSPVCPVVTVGGPSALHAALGPDFDADEKAGAQALWEQVLGVLGGKPTAQEELGDSTFALERLAMTM